MKYKILFIAARPTAGVQYHRLHVPHNALARLHPEFEVDTLDTLEGIADDFLKNYQLVVFSRTLSYAWKDRVIQPADAKYAWDYFHFRAQDIMDQLKRLNIVTVIDLDDTWKLHRDHLYYWNYVREHIGDHNEFCCRQADHVICTTDFFREELTKYNDKITVIPNAIDRTIEQFTPHPTQSPMTRIGWLGSSSHTDDMAPLKAPFAALWKDRAIAHKLQLVLGGYLLNDKVNLLDPKTGNSKPIKMHPSQQVSGTYERIFTDEYKGIREYQNYVKWLQMYEPGGEQIMEPMPYKRIWYQDINKYAAAYNELDVSIAPLLDNFFNNCKSQLKLIEAGFMKKALICSNSHPYTIDAKHGKNCLVVAPNKPMEWYYAIRKMVMEPNLKEDLAAQLHEDVKDAYSIERWTPVRAQLYKSLIDSKNKN